MADVLSQEGATLADVVKTTLYLVDMGEFAAVNEVWVDLLRRQPADAFGRRRRRPADRRPGGGRGVGLRAGAGTGPCAGPLSQTGLPSHLAEAVPDRPHGLDQVGVLLTQLGPEPPDVDVDRAGPAVVLVAPDPAEQRLAGEHLGRVAGQEAQ